MVEKTFLSGFYYNKTTLSGQLFYMKQ